MASSTVRKRAASSTASTPTAAVTAWERCICARSPRAQGSRRDMRSPTKFPDEAIRQLSAVDMMAEK